MPTNTVLQLLGTRVRDLRKQRGLSQEQLGELAGFHFSYIGGVERAEKNISIVNLERIARALKVDVSDLFAYSKMYHTLDEKKRAINEVLELLLRQEYKDIRKAQVILMEIFNENK